MSKRKGHKLVPDKMMRGLTACSRPHGYLIRCEDCDIYPAPPIRGYILWDTYRSREEAALIRKKFGSLHDQIHPLLHSEWWALYKWEGKEV